MKNEMTRQESAFAQAGINDMRRRAAVFGKAGNEARRQQFTRWADALSKLLCSRPRGCSGCAYESQQCGRCVDCARVSNRTDNFTRKCV